MRYRIPAILLSVAMVTSLTIGVFDVRGADREASAGSGKTSPEAAQAGCHAFDFEHGRWKMPNERLVKRLVGSHQWEHFFTYDVGTPLPGCVGDMDIMKTDYWPNFFGVTVRTYDPKTELWRIYWVDNRFSNGEIQPPVVGRFKGNVGIFYGKDRYNGIPILVRFIWNVNPKGSKVVATWSQAFSTDDGKTWEVNWRNELVPDTGL